MKLSNNFNEEKFISEEEETLIYDNAVKTFTQSSQQNIREILNAIEKKDFKKYTDSLCALKSNAHIIGAESLSELAHHLEDCGNSQNIYEIKSKTPELIHKYKIVVDSILDFTKFEEDSDTLLPISVNEIMESIMDIKDAVEAYDFNSANSIMRHLKHHIIHEDFKDLVDELAELLREVDRNEIMILLDGIA